MVNNPHPSFITEIPLTATASQITALDKRLEAARQVYNACLGVIPTPVGVNRIMTTVRELHEKAMNLADSAMIARHEGNADRAVDLVRQALEFETQAANQVPLAESSEPTRSILYRSAASLALQCDELQEARRLTAHGLSGFPPSKITKELLDLLEEIKFKTAEVASPGVNRESNARNPHIYG